MSNLITDKLITPCGKLTNPTLGGYMDAAGNIVGSPSFLTNFVVDYAGNVGAIQIITTDCTFTASIIGSALAPGDWEMQASTVETIGLNGGTISDSFFAGTTAPNLLSTFVSINATGYLDGVVSGTGTWTIRSGADSIGGTNYIGVGLLVTTGDNTHTGPITMQVGSKIQFGSDCSNAITRSKGNLTIGEGAIATQYTSFGNSVYLTQALNNNGTYNIIGCGVCGVGGINLSTTVTNNGVINIDKAAWRNFSTWSGTGTVNVKEGATFVHSNVTIANTTRINLNGNGWKNASCVELGALHSITSSTNLAARINIQSASTIKTAAGVGSVGLTGIISGSAPLTVTSLSTGLGGGYNIHNTANTYNGTLTFDRMVTDASYTTSMQYADVVLVNGARLSSTASQTVGSLSSADPTTAWQIGASTNVFIKDNDITTFAGKFNMTGSIANVWLEGGADNVLTLTNTGHTATMYARDGSKIILEGATFLLGGSGGSGQMRISAGSTISAGTSTTAQCTWLYIDGTSALDVRSITPTSTGLLRVTNGFSMGAGWKINALDPLQPGTYPIIQKPNTTLLTPAPTLGINNTGGNVTFTQVGNFVNMVVS
jgi:hypothetical protein